MMKRVIAISNQKGGVGKTTTAVNLSASLGAAEKKILLIDIDPQANTTSGLGLLSSDVEKKQIYHVLLGEKKIDEAIYPTAVPNLHILPASADLIGFEIEGIDLSEREFCLRRALLQVSNDFDFVLIDCPPSLGLLTINALVAANGVLVPLQCEYFALEGLSRLMRTIDLVTQQLNPSLTMDGIVLTMFDQRNNLAHQVAREALAHFGKKVWSTRIPRNVRISEAPSFGKPIISYDIRSVGAQSYLALAEEFLKRLNAPNSQIGETNERTQSSWTRTLIPDSHP